MKRVGIVYLITEAPEARGVLDTVTETRRKTYCEEASVAMSEVYQANASGHAPSIRLRLPQSFEYRGETLCEYKGERYRIIRDYRDEKAGDSTELTLERVRGNAAPPTPDPEPEEQQAGEGDPSTAPDGSAQDDTEEDAQGEPAGTGGTEENEPAPAEGGEP